MTPLFWAWPDDKLDRFERLLTHGADPNVIIESDFGTGNTARLVGSSITHLATRSKSTAHFKAAFEHGGNPNLVQTSAVGTGDTPMSILIKRGFSDKKQRIELLIKMGADLNQLVSGITLPMHAASWGGQYDIALMLLEAGSDPRIYKENGAMKLTHVLIREEDRGTTGSTRRREDYKKLVDWVERHGESLEEARADLDRWASWEGSIEEVRRKLDAEIAARKARERREKRELQQATGPQTQ